MMANQETPLSDDEAALLVLINDYRSQHGLSTLRCSPTLTAAARWMSEHLAEHNYLTHTDFLGRCPVERMEAFGYKKTCWWRGSITQGGEILRGGSAMPGGAFEAWRNSPGHNALMLADDFVVAGVGKAYMPLSLYGWFWTVDFGKHDDGYPTSTPARSGRASGQWPVKGGDGMKRLLEWLRRNRAKDMTDREQAVRAGIIFGGLLAWVGVGFIFGWPLEWRIATCIGAVCALLSTALYCVLSVREAGKR